MKLPGRGPRFSRPWHTQTSQAETCRPRRGPAAYAGSLALTIDPAAIPQLQSLSPFEDSSVKYLLLIYNDATMLDPLPGPETDALMRDCFEHADQLRDDGKLIDSQQLEAPRTARTLRIRHGRPQITDGPFTEAKEVLGGFNLIEARDIEEATAVAMQFPWAQTGAIEIRPVRDIGAVRRRVDAEASGRGVSP
jgi:hypothetical protein